MLRPRVSLGTTVRKQVVDLSVQVVDIDRSPEGLSVPSIIATVIKEVIKEKAPSPPRGLRTVVSSSGEQTLIPFIFEPVFSGADISLDSDENRTILSWGTNSVRVKCDTVLLELTEPIPVRIYLTGKERDLTIDGQRCTVDVFDSSGYTKCMGLVKRDGERQVYIEVQKNGVEWEAGKPHDRIRFHIDTIFTW